MIIIEITLCNMHGDIPGVVVAADFALPIALAIAVACGPVAKVEIPGIPVD